MSVSVSRKYDATVDHDIAKGNSHEAAYIIRGAVDEFAARQALEAVIPFMEEGQFALGHSIKNIGPTQFDATVKYGFPTLEDLELSGSLPGGGGSNPFTLATFSSMGGSAHITQSLNTDIIALHDQDPPDFRGAIGVTDTAIEGVDVPTPRVEFVLHTKRPLSLISSEYMKYIGYSVGKTNLYTWLTFGPCELMFMGFDSTLSSDGQYAFAFKFAASPTKTIELNVGEPLGVVTFTKRGWEYVWFRYRKSVDADAKAVVHVPLAAYKERIAEELDFATLMVF
jgi:hypothetical protein